MPGSRRVKPSLPSPSPRKKDPNNRGRNDQENTPVPVVAQVRESYIFHNLADEQPSPVRVRVYENESSYYVPQHPWSGWFPLDGEGKYFWRARVKAPGQYEYDFKPNYPILDFTGVAYTTVYRSNAQSTAAMAYAAGTGAGSTMPGVPGTWGQGFAGTAMPPLPPQVSQYLRK